MRFLFLFREGCAGSAELRNAGRVPLHPRAGVLPDGGARAERRRRKRRRYDELRGVKAGQGGSKQKRAPFPVANLPIWGLLSQWLIVLKSIP